MDIIRIDMEIIDNEFDLINIIGIVISKSEANTSIIPLVDIANTRKSMDFIRKDMRIFSS